MVAASLIPASRVRALDVIPVINLSWRRERVCELMLRASEEYGFFKVINHGVPQGAIEKMEAQVAEFFAQTIVEKQRSGPPSPLGYGSRNIGLNGDTGELEYLLLPANPTAISQRARTICRKDPIKFSGPANEYVDAVKGLACEILDILAEGLGLQDTRAFSKLITDRESDSLMRLNHYPSCLKGGSEGSKSSSGASRIGFGEHSDPQLISLLRSNDVQGLQILTPTPDGGVWVPVPPDPNTFCISIGDLLQALTNGRLTSVRHRAMANSCCSRLSMVFFGGPTPRTLIAPLPEMITPASPRRYNSFTWAEYKKAMYTLRLGYNRLDLYRVDDDVQGEGVDLAGQF